MKNNETSRGKVADGYDDILERQDGTYQKEVILPNLMRLLGAKTGENILDLACGQGFFAREIEATGAKVLAVDISSELINIARRHSPKTIEYVVAPSHQLAFCPDKSIDKVVIILALQNIENLTGTLDECSRVLKTGGRLFIVLNHPTFRIPKRSSWQWDIHLEYRRIDAYMSESREKIETDQGEDVPTWKKFTVFFHRPLQVYFKGLMKAGFVISRLEEWVSHKQSKAGSRAIEENRIQKEIPLFLFLEAVKK